MWNAKRAVDAIAVLNRYIHLVSIVLIMALLAEVVGAKAAEEGHAAAELAFPVDLLHPMLLALGLSSTYLLQQAGLAEEVLFLGRLFLSVCHLLPTVDQSTKVGLLAIVALVEGAPVVRKLLWPAKVVV